MCVWAHLERQLRHVAALEEAAQVVVRDGLHALPLGCPPPLLPHRLVVHHRLCLAQLHSDVMGVGVGAGEPWVSALLSTICLSLGRSAHVPHATSASCQLCQKGTGSACLSCVWAAAMAAEMGSSREQQQQHQPPALPGPPAPSPQPYQAQRLIVLPPLHHLEPQVVVQLGHLLHKACRRAGGQVAPRDGSR